MTLAVVSSLTFFVFSALPADPVRSALGANASVETVARVRAELGLDRPLLDRYLDFAHGVVRFEFGTSFVTMRPVIQDMTPALMATAAYVIIALAIAACLSAAITAAAHFGEEPINTIALEVVRLVTSLPSIVIALAVGMLFMVGISSASVPRSDEVNTVLAAVALAVYPTCSLTEILLTERGRLMSATHFRAATAFGFDRVQLFLAFVARGVFVPWLSQFSNVAASLVTGAVVVELAFSLPGLGTLLARSVLRNDLPAMQAIVVSTVSAFLLVDAATRWLVARFSPPAR